MRKTILWKDQTENLCRMCRMPMGSRLGSPRSASLCSSQRIRGSGDSSKGCRPRRMRRFKVRPHALGVKPGFRNLSSNQIYDQIEAEASLKKP
jgi:hypothetical protein